MGARRESRSTPHLRREECRAEHTQFDGSQNLALERFALIFGDSRRPVRPIKREPKWSICRVGKTPAQIRKRRRQRNPSGECARQRGFGLVLDHDVRSRNRKITGQVQHDACQPRPAIGRALFERLHPVTERQRETGFALRCGALQLGEHLGHSRLRLSPMCGPCEFDPVVWSR